MNIKLKEFLQKGKEQLTMCCQKALGFLKQMICGIKDSFSKKQENTPQGKKKKHRRRKNRKKRVIAWVLRVASMVIILFLLVLFVVGVKALVTRLTNHERQPLGWPSYVKEEYLTVNSYSRPALSMGVVKNIVIHTTCDPEATINSRRDYYENLKDEQNSQESVHIIAGSNGKMVLCIPIDEIAYASESKNTESISIEVLVSEEYEFLTDEAYENLTDLVAWLCYENNIPLNGVIRHYDVNGRNCPSCFVSDEKAWNAFKTDLQKKWITYRNDSITHEE